jgi:response regulator NasT
VAFRLPLLVGMIRTPRWRVAIVDDHERSRAALRAAIWAAGGEVAGEAVRFVDALAVIRRTRPDVTVVAVGLPDGDGVKVAAEVKTGEICPVVLFTARTTTDIATRAAAAGVMGYLHKPLRPAELAPTLDIALARFQELQTLRRQLEERKVIERAKGVLMTRYGISEDSAFQRLRRSAMDNRRPMVEIARALLVSEPVLATYPAAPEADA